MQSLLATSRLVIYSCVLFLLLLALGLISGSSIPLTSDTLDYNQRSSDCATTCSTRPVTAYEKSISALLSLSTTFLSSTDTPWCRVQCRTPSTVPTTDSPKMFLCSFIRWNITSEKRRSTLQLLVCCGSGKVPTVCTARVNVYRNLESSSNVQVYLDGIPHCQPVDCQSWPSFQRPEIARSRTPKH